MKLTQRRRHHNYQCTQYMYRVNSGENDNYGYSMITMVHSPHNAFGFLKATKCGIHCRVHLEQTAIEQTAVAITIINVLYFRKSIHYETGKRQNLNYKFNRLSKCGFASHFCRFAINSVSSSLVCNDISISYCARFLIYFK